MIVSVVHREDQWPSQLFGNTDERGVAMIELFDQRYASIVLHDVELVLLKRKQSIGPMIYLCFVVPAFR